MIKKEIKINYDPDIYLSIQETGRLVKLKEGLPHLLNDDEVKKLEVKQVGPTFIFTSKYTFNTRHLSQILDIHTPIEADSFKDDCKDNVLTLRFYRREIDE